MSNKINWLIDSLIDWLTLTEWFQVIIINTNNLQLYAIKNSN